MRAIRTCIFASLVAACGGSDEKPVDALIIIPDAAIDAPPDAFEPTFDFSCMGNTQGTATATVTLSGFAGEVVVTNFQPDLVPATSATVDFCPASSITCAMADKLDTQTTAASGCPQTGCTFTSDPLATTAGAPLDLYVKLSKATDLTTYIYPSAPVTVNTMNIPGVLFSQGVIQALGAIGITQDPAKAIMLVAATDCMNMPITDTANLALTIKQGGQAVQGTQVFDASMLDPMLAGTFAIFNVPTGTAGSTSALTEVGGTYKTKALRAHEVRVHTNSTTATQLRPGF